MKNEKIKAWIKAAAIRAIKTIAQSFAATIPTTAITIGEVNWQLALSTAILSGILSICTSIAGLPEVEDRNGK